MKRTRTRLTVRVLLNNLVAKKYKGRHNARTTLTRFIKKTKATAADVAKLEEAFHRHYPVEEPAAGAQEGAQEEPEVEVQDGGGNTMNLLGVDKIPFNGDILMAIEQGDEAFIIVRRVTDMLGIDLSGQLQKLARAPWARVVMTPTHDSDGREQAMACLPVDQFPMWMVTMQVDRVRKEARPMLIKLQCEASVVLAEHFKMKRSSRAQASPSPTEGTLPHIVSSIEAMTTSIASLVQRVDGLVTNLASIVMQSSSQTVTHKHTHESSITLERNQMAIGRLETNTPDNMANPSTWCRRFGLTADQANGAILSLGSLFSNRYYEHYGVHAPKMNDGDRTVDGITVKGTHRLTLAYMPHNYGVWLLSLLESVSNGFWLDRNGKLGLFNDEANKAANEYRALVKAGVERIPDKLRTVYPPFVAWVEAP